MRARVVERRAKNWRVRGKKVRPTQQPASASGRPRPRSRVLRGGQLGNREAQNLYERCLLANKNLRKKKEENIANARRRPLATAISASAEPRPSTFAPTKMSAKNESSSVVFASAAASSLVERASSAVFVLATRAENRRGVLLSAAAAAAAATAAAAARVAVMVERPASSRWPTSSNGEGGWSGGGGNVDGRLQIGEE